jgi:hypothetical protein
MRKHWGGESHFAEKLSVPCSFMPPLEYHARPLGAL